MGVIKTITIERSLASILLSFLMCGMFGVLSNLLLSDMLIYYFLLMFGIGGMMLMGINKVKRDGIVHYLPKDYQAILFEKFVELVDRPKSHIPIIFINRSPFELMCNYRPDRPMPVTISLLSMGYSEKEVFDTEIED